MIDKDIEKESNKKNIKETVNNYLDKIIIFSVIFLAILLFIKIVNPEFFYKINFIERIRFEKYGKWIVARDKMANPRSIATANLLPDGNVLIMGGQTNGAGYLAEVFDPKQMKIVKKIPLEENRTDEYIAQTLKNGDVFVIGGYVHTPETFFKLTNTTKIFDSKNYIFKNTKPVKYSSECMKTYLLNNGNVLILNNPLTYLLEELNQRKNMKFEIYMPEKDEYTETQNGIHKTTIGAVSMVFENGDILFNCFGPFPNSNDKKWSSRCLYKYEENKFEPYEDIPSGQLFVQLDSESYLVVNPQLTFSDGYTYNIKTREKIYVKNHINRTWRPGIFPKAILLKNGNVLILDIPLKNSSDEYELRHKNKKTAKYSAYLYDKKLNKFYEVPAPPYPVYKAGIVMLENGDILVAGGSIKYNKFSDKIQIYKYKH